jgi:hypothetical protein
MLDRLALARNDQLAWRVGCSVERRKSRPSKKNHKEKSGDHEPQPDVAAGVIDCHVRVWQRRALDH